MTLAPTLAPLCMIYRYLQVDALRSEMSAEVVSLFNIVRAREAQLASAKATRR
jgi:hypothetical protein